MRTPLTRKNLAAAETRCKQLEKILRQLRPEIEIEKSLETIANSDYMNSDHSHITDPKENAGTESVEPHGDCDFEWHEAPSLVGHKERQEDVNRRDGMASLAACGYLGRKRS
jgi:transcriptional regulatory protein GAL4